MTWYLDTRHSTLECVEEYEYGCKSNRGLTSWMYTHNTSNLLLLHAGYHLRRQARAKG